MKEKIISRRVMSNDARLKDLDSKLVAGEVVEKEKEKFVHATLLIPEHLLPYFQTVLARDKANRFIQRLLKQCKQALLVDENLFSSSVNTLYQENHQNLYKKSFYVEASVWCELKQLRLIMNWSICRIMTFLLYLDSTGFFEALPESVLDLVVPRIEIFLQYGKIFLSTKKSKFIRRFYYRRFVPS
jgi:hypothetical protein